MANVYDPNKHKYPTGLTGGAANASVAGQYGLVPQQQQQQQQPVSVAQQGISQYNQAITPGPAHQQAQQLLLNELSQPVDSASFLNQAKQAFGYDEAQQKLGVFDQNISDIERMQQGLKEELDRPNLGFTMQERGRIEEHRGGKLREQLASMVSGYNRASSQVSDIQNKAMQMLQIKQQDRQIRVQNIEKMISLLDVPQHQKDMAKLQLELTLQEKQKQDQYELLKFKSELDMSEFYQKLEVETALKFEQLKHEELANANTYFNLTNQPQTIGKLINNLSDIINRPEYRGVPIEGGIEGIAYSIYDAMSLGYEYRDALGFFMDDLNKNPMVVHRMTEYQRDLEKHKLSMARGVSSGGVDSSGSNLSITRDQFYNPATNEFSDKAGKGFIKVSTVYKNGQLTSVRQIEDKGGSNVHTPVTGDLNSDVYKFLYDTGSALPHGFY